MSRAPWNNILHPAADTARRLLVTASVAAGLRRMHLRKMKLTVDNKDQFTSVHNYIDSHNMNDDRKRLARKVNDEFFLSKKETAPEQQSANEGMAQLIQMLNASPDLVGPLLQMTQIMGAKLN